MSMNSKEIGAAIRAARNGLGLSQAVLAERVGIKQASLQSIETGATARSKHLPFIARELGLSPESVGLPPNQQTEKVIQEVYPAGETEPITSRLGAQTLPILGITMGGRSDKRGPDFWMNGQIVRYAARPRRLEGQKDVFGLYVDGDSMEPRFFAKDMVVVERANPAPGDDVVIELKSDDPADEHDNPSFIKQFVARRGSQITVRQFNPKKEIVFDLKEIKNLFRVIPLKELMA